MSYYAEMVNTIRPPAEGKARLIRLMPGPSAEGIETSNLDSYAEERFLTVIS